MRLPNSINGVIKQEIDRTEESRLIQLIRRKGNRARPLENTSTSNQTATISVGVTNAKSSAYDLLSDEAKKKELLEFWTKFHSQFHFPNFAAFYRKRNFCAYFSQSGGDTLPPLANHEDSFIWLLADRRFLFLEDSEHGNNPEYPPMSEIVRNPKRYLTSEELPGKPNASQIADKRMRENARVVLEQGFVPTYAHKWAYHELRRNEEEIRSALRQRAELMQRGSQFPSFTIHISGSEEPPSPTDIELGQLFHDFLYAAVHKAYVKKYDGLLAAAQTNSLSAIICVRKFLEGYSEIQICKALVFWRLFTQEATKLAKGELSDFQFRMPAVKTGRRLTKQTQAPSYRKIDCQIMLFDYLLKLLPPAGENEKQEIAYAKFQFHAFTRYNGYTHFRVKDTQDLTCDPKSGCKFDFGLIPDSKDCVDYLGGVIRHHILRCIPNDVRWLEPGLPNNWGTNSSILATLLLQDTSCFPKERRLTNRIYAFLKDQGGECIQTYLDFEGGQSALIEQLNKWCIDNDLKFEDDIPSSDMELSDDKMKLLCSRFVLEYMLKERALQEVRQNLSAVAQRLWGNLLFTDFETFSLEDDA